MSGEDRKRKASGTVESAEGEEPPRKRTCTDEDPAAAEQDKVVLFQKEAIWRQMQEYRREFNLGQERIQELQSEAVHLKTNLKTLWSCFEGLASDLKIASDEGQQDQATLMESRKKRAAVGRLLISAVTKDSLEPHVLALCKDLKTLFGVVCAKSNLDITEEHVLAKHDKLATEVSAIQITNEELKAEKEALLERLSKSEKLRKRSEKQRDRRESKTVNEVFLVKDLPKGEDSETAVPKDSEGAESLFKDDQSSTPSDAPRKGAPGIGQGSPRVKKEEPMDPQVETLLSQEFDEASLAIEAQKLGLTQRCSFYAHLAEKRLTEQDEKNQTILNLRKELDDYRIKLTSIPESVVQEHALTKALRSQLALYRNEMEGWRGHAEALSKDLEEVKIERRKLADQIDMDDAAQRKHYEQEIKKLESECARLRTNRDHLQHQLDVRTSKDAVTMEQNQEIRVLANSRKDLIESLHRALHRLKLKRALERGDTKEMSQLQESWERKQGNLEKVNVDEEMDLRTQLREKEDMLEKLRRKLEVIDPKLANGHMEANGAASVHSDSPETETTKPDLAERVVNLEKELACKKVEYEKITSLLQESAGDKDILGMSGEDLKRCLSDVLENLQKTLAKRDAEIDYLQTTERTLTEEVDTLSRAWNQLEEQNKRKVLDLTEKEDRIVRLLMDKTKCEQKFALASKARDQANGVVAALKKESDKQLEYIRKLEDREKNLSQQVLNNERQNGILNSTLRSHRDRFNEILNQNTEVTTKLERSDVRFHQMKALIKEKTDIIEHEKQRQKRLLDEVDVVKQQHEETLASKEPTDDELKRLVDDYKAALKCSACNDRFKTHAIMRCMHVFCNPCLQSRLETRQRKCPTCNNMFLQSDVRRIYL